MARHPRLRPKVKNRHRGDAGISVLLASLLSRLEGWVWRNVRGFTGAVRRWIDQQSTRAANWANQAYRVAPSNSFLFEALEPRVLLSADLGGSITAFSPSASTPGSASSATVQLLKTGSDALGDSVRVKIFASPDATLDATDRVIGQVDVQANQLTPNVPLQINVPLDTGSVGKPGSYQLFSSIDPDHTIPESDETNNVSQAASALQLSNTFGQVGVSTTIPSLTLTDADGTRFTLAIAGKGTVVVDHDANGYLLQITGSDATTQLSLTAAGGDGRVSFSGITAAGPIKSINASSGDLKGNLTVSGPLSTLVLGDGTGAAITTSGTGTLDVTARVFNGVKLATTQVLGTLKLTSWNAPTPGSSSLQAAGLNSATVTQGFAADVALSGIGAGALVLGTFSAGGAIGASQWNIAGRSSSITAASTDIGWHANIKGALTQFTTVGNASGLLALGSLQVLQIGGSAINFTLLVGADLGSDAALGGTGTAADKFSAGTLARARITGGVTDSLIVVSINPVNGVFNDGNDIVLGTATNRVQEIYIGGQLGATSRIVAPAMPTTAKINGQTLDAAALAALPQLSTQAVDSFAPILTAQLVNGTGASNSDGLTKDPNITGTAIDLKGTTQLLGVLDAAAGVVPTINLSSSLQAGGSFTITAGQLATLAGGTLAQGAHTLRLIAADAAGNKSTPVEISFTLDSEAPTVISLDLDPASDTGTLGDQITTATLVTLLGRSAPATTVKLLGLDVITQTDADGFFSFAGLPLALGANLFSLELTDAAGNTSQTNVVLTRQAVPDTTTPTLSAALQSDTGQSASDHITRNPAIAGTVADNIGVTLLQVALDPGATPVFTDLTSSIQPDGSFTLTKAQLDTLAGGTLADGAHALRLVATDAAGNSSASIDISFTLDTSAPGIDSFAFSAADAIDGNSTQTGSARAQLKGHAEEGATITLASQGLSAVAGAGGLFVLPDVQFTIGDNVLTLTATDAAGNSSTLTQTLTRVAQVQADAVLAWNDMALRAIKLDATYPEVATRTLAMMSLAQYDTLAAIEGSPAYLVKLSVNGPANAQAAAAVAAHRILSLTYPAQKSIFDAALATTLGAIPDSAAKDTGIALGLAVADAVWAARQDDGSDAFVDYSGSQALGKWRPTSPMFTVAEEPQWGGVTPFALTSADQFRPGPAPALDTAAYAAAINEVKSLGSATASTRTADQTQQAHFWADGRGSYTPPGHWNQIASEVASAQGLSLSATARLFAQLNVAMADAGIAAWDAKYTYGTWRPVDAIHNADLDGNDATVADANWTSLLISPAHPDYVSGHSTFSGAASTVLAAAFGDNTSFSTTSVTLPGVTRSFTSFTQAAEEAGKSRIYGGIHTEYANAAGKALGRQVGAAVLARFALTLDTQAPTVAVNSVPAATNTNLTITGQVLDNLSGVAGAQYRINNGALQDLVLGANGAFNIATTLATDGSADGSYVLTVVAHDAGGNQSAGVTRSFVLDTKAPVLDLSSLAEGDSVTGASRLTGTAAPTGTTLTLLNYRIDDGATHSLVFDAASGAFDAALPYGTLNIGNHTLTINASDAAGNTATLTRTVQVEALSTFTLIGITPGDGSSDVGVTQRPIVSFSRAVNASTLTANSVYATAPDGSKLAATIVPAADGTFAWLFFTNPLPGGSQITLHVDGSKIRAGADGSFLDADGDGTASGERTVRFTTVSTTVVSGTKLVGKIVDPGPDLEPMTFDDIRRGPDGIIHTPDDVFLNPIAHAKVYILGLEDQFVYTDASGNFELTNVPSGSVKVAIDGRTATNAPAGVFFPEMVMAVEFQAGIVNTMMGSMGTTEERLANADRKEVYLPRVATSVLQAVSNTEPTVITIEDAKAAPALTEQQREALTLTIKPGSAVDANGQVLSNVQIGISTVPPELVRDMLPPGVLQHTFDITIQAPGVATFTEPVQITFPNVFNAAPGTKLNILSFDHTTGMLVINGTGTVSADGLTVVSDEGSGVKAPGWHGLTPPGTVANGEPDNSCLTEDERAKNLSLGAGVLVGETEEIIRNGATASSEFGRIFNVEETSFGKFLSKIDIASNAIRILTELENDNTNWYKVVRDTGALIGGVLAVTAVAEGTLFFGLPAGAVIAATGIAYAVLDVVESLTEYVPKAQRILDAAKEMPACSGTDDAKDQAIREAESALRRARDLAQQQAPVLKGVADAIAPLPSLIQRLLPPPGTTDTSALPPPSKEDIGKLKDGLGRIKDFIDAHKNDEEPPFWTQILPESPDDSDSVFGSINRVLGFFFDPVPQPSDAYTPGSCGVDWRVEGSSISLYGKSMDGKINVVLPPDQTVVVSVYDAAKKLYGEKVIHTSQSGVNTSIGSIPMATVDGLTDQDGDGLVDLAEQVIGTSITNRDTDGDGISDGYEAETCSNPLSGFQVAQGIIASIALQGTAQATVVSGSPSDPSNLTAFVATGSYGLAIADVSRFSSPRVLSELDLAGTNVDVAADLGRGLAVVAANEAGLHIVDVSNPSTPLLRQTIGFNSPVTHVEVHDGIAYVATGADLATVDLNTGDINQVFDLVSLGGTALTDIAVDGNTVYTMDSNHVLRAIPIEDNLLTLSHSLTLPDGGGKLFVGGGVAFVGTVSGFIGGFLTVDVADSTELSLLSGVDANNIAGSAIAANGSGLAVTIGNPGGVFVLDVVSVTDPTNTGNFITRINLPAAPKDVVLANGLAFVADGTGGLQIVNYIGFDNKGIAPTVTIAVQGIDADPATPGTQALEGRTVRVVPTITDDVQVRNVELLVNGQVISNDVSFPFELFTQAPAIAVGGTTLTLQARATDTGGNVGLSAPITLTVVPDTFAPVVNRVSLIEGATVFFVRSVDVTFDEPIDLQRFDASAVRLVRAGADGLFDTADDTTAVVRIDSRSQGQSVSILPEGYLPAGQYRLTIDPAKVADKAGNAMADAIVRNFTVRPASGVRAEQGIPAAPVAPSANPGQEIGVPVSFDPATARMRFVIIDSSGNRSTRDVAVRRIDVAQGLAYFTVPLDAGSGDVTLFSQVGNTQTIPSDGVFPLQIVPILTDIQVQSVSADGTSAVLLLRGSGFVEGNNSEYRFGSGIDAVVVTDGSTSSGPDVGQIYDYSTGQYINGVSVTVPLSNGSFGPITVKTAGGTSASYSVNLSSIQSVALSGTPADATQASANAGQAILLAGTGLNTTTDVLLRYTNTEGAARMVQLSPIAASADGTQATLVLPTYANGAFSLQVFGSAAQPLLQIVPVLTRLDNASNALLGTGLVEGATRYDFAGSSINDTQASAGIDVSSFYQGYDPSLGYVYSDGAGLSTLGHNGLGSISVTTAGGTSAAITTNTLRPGSDGAPTGVLSDLAVDPVSGTLWAVDTTNPGHLLRINEATGLVLQTITLDPSFGNQYTANYAGLQVLPQAMSLAGTNVPAGSLLLFAGYPYNSNASVAAVNPDTGEVIAELTLSTAYYSTAGVFDTTSGHLFILSEGVGKMVELDPDTGAEIASFSLPLNVNSYAGLAIDPTDGNFWIGSYNGASQLVQIDRSGVELRRIDLSGQGVGANEISGLAFAPDGSLRVSSTTGVVYKVALADTNPATQPATLAQIIGSALNGTAAQAGVAAANVGQVIELVGTNFGTGTQVLFNTRNNDGSTGVVAVKPLIINSTGTRLQVLVPDLASTGDVKVSKAGNTSAGVRLQVVPTLTSLSGSTDGDGSIGLQGSGFMEGAFTVTVGGVVLADTDTANSPFDVTGTRNGSVSVVAPHTLDGPVRITTEGGYAELAAPVFGAQALVQFDGITASANAGAPADATKPSATTGQTIVLTGQAFTSSTLVQFQGIDDTGRLGTLTRSGTVGSNGTTFSVVVPALARSGAVTVLGSNASYDLQIVPTLRAVGGAVAAGNTIVLEGTGLTANDLLIQIDGHGVGSFTVRTINDGPNNLYYGINYPDQQLITLVVPTGVTVGVITVSTAGGASTLRTGAATVTALGASTPTTDVGDTLATALATVLGTNQSVKISSDLPSVLDVDLYRLDLSAGEQVTLSLSDNSTATQLRVFDANGQQLTNGYKYFGDTSALRWSAPATGTFYVGVSGYYNTTYNPQVPNSGTNGNWGGNYTLNIERLGAGASRLSGINASATSGTAANAAVASANTGQAITLNGSGLLASDVVVFSTIDDSGNLGYSNITPTTVAPDGSSLSVIVPTTATTGSLRLERDPTGILLQIVPTVSDVTASNGSVFNGGGITLSGSGFAEGSSSVLFGNQRVDDVGRYYGIDSHSNNTGINLTVPQGMPTGPIRVSTVGGTSAALGLTLSGIAVTATSGSATNAGQVSANLGQTLTLNGVGFDLSLDIVFQTIDTNGSRSEVIVRPTVVNAAGTQARVTIPSNAVTGTVRVVGDFNGAAIPLQIVPILTDIQVQSVSADGTSAVLLLRGSGCGIL